MTQCTKLIQCMVCGTECVLSFDPELGNPMFCPFCSEEIIDEEDFNMDLNDDGDDINDDEDDDYPIDDRIMRINLH